MLNTVLLDLLLKRLIHLQAALARAQLDSTPSATQDPESTPASEALFNVADLSFEIYQKLSGPLRNAEDPIPRMGAIVNLYFRNLFKSYQKVANIKTSLDENEIEFFQSKGKNKELSEKMLKQVTALHSSLLPTMLEFRDQIIGAVDPAYRSD